MLNSVNGNKTNAARSQIIDLLKGLCILFVIFTHFSWTHRERLLMGFPFWIDMAVPVFMLISGYVNSLSYNRKNIQSAADAYELKNWLKSFIRYTVPYIIIYILEAVALLINSLSSTSIGGGIIFHGKGLLLRF